MQTSLTLKTRHFISGILLSIVVQLLPVSAYGQLVTLVRADEKDKGAVTYEIALGADKDAALNAIYSKGHERKNIFYQDAITDDKPPLTKGFLVVVRCEAKNSSGILTSHLGIGISKTGYDEAEQRATKDLARYYWSWSAAKGYKVVERRNFDAGQPQNSVVVLAVYKKDTSGNKKLISSNMTFSTMTNEEYQTIRNKQCTYSEKFEFEITQIYASSGKVAVLKTTSVSDKNISTDEIVLAHALIDGQYNMDLHEEGAITKPGESPKYIKVNEMVLEKATPSAYYLVLQYLNKKIVNPIETKPANNDKTKNASVGVRG